jgi:uncharacterized protein involved in response to NO
MGYSAKREKTNYFLSQPHQPFFILGIINALLMVLLFGLSYKGFITLEMPTLQFHVYSLIFTFFTNVFTGFLFTTFPRFCQTQVITQKYYLNVFYLSAFGSLLFLFGAFSNYLLMVIGMVLLFLSQVFIVVKLQEVYLSGTAHDKKDAFWILTANYFGLLGHFLFIFIAFAGLSSFSSYLFNITIALSFYLYLIFLAFSVAQRMIPFFSHSFAQKNGNFVKIIFVLFVLKTLMSAFDVKIGEILIDLILALYMLIEFRRWELPLFTSTPILWVLHLALFWLPTAFLLSALSLISELFLDTSLYFFNIHLLALGFLTTVLIGFGTRVTLGHSGQAPHADRLAASIFWFIQIVVVLRALFSFNVAFEWGADFLFDISLSAWLILFLVWALRYGKVLLFGSKL